MVSNHETYSQYLNMIPVKKKLGRLPNANSFVVSDPTQAKKTQCNIGGLMLCKAYNLTITQVLCCEVVYEWGIRDTRVCACCMVALGKV